MANNQYVYDLVYVENWLNERHWQTAKVSLGIWGSDETNLSDPSMPFRLCITRNTSVQMRPNQLSNVSTEKCPAPLIQMTCIATVEWIQNPAMFQDSLLQRCSKIRHKSYLLMIQSSYTQKIREPMPIQKCREKSVHWKYNFYLPFWVSSSQLITLACL
jgi:hypothetical protein